MAYNVEFIPASKRTVFLDAWMFSTIVCLIPAGKLSTIEAICEMWAKRKGADWCELGSCSLLPIFRTVLWSPADVQRIDFIDDLSSLAADDDNRVPYWRIVSQRGYLIDLGNGRYSSKESQKSRLEREGHAVVRPNPEKRMYRVPNYKASLFDLNRLIINEG